MEILIVFLLILSATARQGPFYITEEKHPHDEDLQTEMDRSLEKDTNYYYFTPRQTDDYEIVVEDDNHCKWISKVEKPYMVSDGVNQYTIVQTNNFEQNIRTTRCMHAGEGCGNVVGLDQLNMTAKCTQKYEKLPFYYYHKQSIRVIYVQVPMCCSCNLVPN